MIYFRGNGNCVTQYPTTVANICLGKSTVNKERFTLDHALGHFSAWSLCPIAVGPVASRRPWQPGSEGKREMGLECQSHLQGHTFDDSTLPSPARHICPRLREE